MLTEIISRKRKLLDFCLQTYLFVTEHNNSVVHGCVELRSGVSEQNVHVSLVLDFFRKMHIVFHAVDVVGGAGVRALE
jgi:hypothetical protein